jgi:hypothetical protein
METQQIQNGQTWFLISQLPQMNSCIHQNNKAAILQTSFLQYLGKHGASNGAPNITIISLVLIYNKSTMTLPNQQ